MYTLVAFATQWGSSYGGINSFNADFLAAFGIAYNQNARIICIVASASQEEIDDAAKSLVQLVPLPYSPAAKTFDSSHGLAGVEQLNKLSISFDPEKTIWLGHDRITGEAAIAAAKLAGGKSAVIHHMSYDHYESYAENSQSAQEKTRAQISIFQKADLVFAVGPLLRDAAQDRIDGSKPVHMLIPGLADLEPQGTRNTFVAFLSGRLSDDAARIKQGHLGIAAFATAQREARKNNWPEALRNQPKLLLRGVDFEGQLVKSSSQDKPDPEKELTQFAEEYADEIVNLHALPYTTDREQLHFELSRASVALMPSWHEGFGLVAWEAIAAGVPLIISQKSGVYRFLKEEYLGAGIGCVYALDIRGATTHPFFHEEDLRATTAKLKDIANNPGQSRKQASILRNLVSKYTWPACAEQAAKDFGWNIEKGSVSADKYEPVAQKPDHITPSPSVTESGPIHLPARQWRPGTGMAYSQLLRAEEALLPFDPARQPEIDTLNIWLDDSQWPLSVRLITGAGGHGKTRLALELCQQRQAAGWHTGFLDSSLEASKMSGIWQSLFNLHQPLLIVIDYAETRQPAFLGLLKAALQKISDYPVRILLLARDGGEWWDNLPGKDSLCEAFLSGYATTGPFQLPALYAAEPDRQDAYKKALWAFAEALGVSVPDIVPDLAGEHFERPLYVQMAALLALYGERPTTAQGVTKALLNHERRYWQGVLAGFSWSEPERHAEQLLALTTLAGGFAIPKDAEPYWVKTNGTVLRSADFNTLFRALVPLYPGTQGLQSLRPDLLGEALVAQALLRTDASSLLNSVLNNHASQSVRRNALTVLARLSTQRPDLQEPLVDALAHNFRYCCVDMIAVSRETISYLADFAELAFARLPLNDKSQTSGLLAPLFKEESVQLAKLTCLVAEFQVEKTHRKLENKSGNVALIQEYAIALERYEVALGRTGRHHQAGTPGLKAVELFRQLMVNSMKRFEPDYAHSLNNYASHLRDTGQWQEALIYSCQALEIYKRLANQNPDRFEADYAWSLQNYAFHLNETGQREAALTHDREALEIYKRLAANISDRFEPDYAISLTNYASHLRDAYQWQEASIYACESLEIFRRLADKNLDRFGAELFNATCSVQFNTWLCDQNHSSYKPNLNQLIKFLPLHRRSFWLLYSAFVEGCLSTDSIARKNAFRKVLSHWNETSTADKFLAAPYWLCTVAWFATYEPAALEEIDWQAHWQQFVKQQNGNIPKWIAEVAQRLEFQLPEAVFPDVTNASDL